MEKELYSSMLFAVLKKRNKRIYIKVWKSEKTDDVVITVDTKKLIGNWKDRNIHSSGVVYGLESFLAITNVFDMIACNPLFLKTANREIGQLMKDKMSCITNITQ